MSNEGDFPLLSAVTVATPANGYAAAVSLLCDRGADVNQRAGRNDFTAAHMACEQGKADLLRILLARGAVD